MTLQEKIVFLVRLPNDKKGWLLLCLIGAVVYPVAIKLLSLKWLTRRLGQPIGNTQLCSIANPAQERAARRISSIMNTISKNVPWPCLCLPQAVCVKRICDFHNIPCVVYLGAKLDADEPSGMKAHAWVGVGRFIVIGGRNSPIDYQITATFVS